jgi:DNA anti-recombination protein RmuC
LFIEVKERYTDKEMNVESLADILEHELSGAFDVKDKGSLQRYISVLAEQLSWKESNERNEREHAEFREAIIRIDTRLEEGFRRMDQRFEAVDQRFEAVDRRFEAIDKRFETMQHSLDKRFEALDKRFETMQHSMDNRFESLQHSMDKRFESLQNSMDKRFDDVNLRFEDVNRRFDDVNRRFDMMFRFVTVGFVVLATLMSIYQFLG